MKTTAASRPPEVPEQTSDELRDAVIREARQRARRRRSMYVGAVVVTAVAAIAALSTAWSGKPPPPAALDELPPPGPRTSAAASPTTTSASVPLQKYFPAGMRLVYPGPVPSPDFTKTVYDARDDSTGKIGELYVEEAGTGVRTQITHLDLGYGGEFPLAPTFTPDGQTVLFMLPNLSRLYGSDVWSVPVTGGEPTLVVEHAMWPAPLPDGKTIAYVSEPRVSSDGHRQRVSEDIWVASIHDPGSARLVTSTTGNGIFGMSASPDGTKLTYHEDGAGDHGVDIATGRSTSP